MRKSALPLVRSFSARGKKRKSPKLVDVEDGGEAPFVVVHGDELVLVEEEEAESRLLEHAVLLLLALGPLQVGGDLDGAQVAPGAHVEEGEALGIGGGQEGAVGVDADGLVPGEAVAAEVQVNGVEAALRIGVDLDVAALGDLGGALHHADLKGERDNKLGVAPKDVFEIRTCSFLLTNS